MNNVSTPAVTIGLPVSAQSAEYFEQAVRSVFAQSYRNWELLIVLDGAPAEIVALASAIDDERVRVVLHPQRAGLAKRLNEIAELARGHFIARMDADDVMAPSRLDEQLAVLGRAGNDLVSARAYTIDDQDALRGLLPEDGRPRDDADYLKSHFITHPTVMFTKEWALKHPYDSSYLRGEDKELWFRSRATTKLVKLEQRLLFYRVSRDPDVSKQRISAQHDRRFLKSAARLAAIPRYRVLIDLLRSHLRQATYGLAARLGGGSILYRRHYRVLPDEERAHALRAFDRARFASVPGWADPS